MSGELEHKNYPAIQFRVARPTQRLDDVVRFYTEGLKLKLLSSFKDHNGYSGVMIGLPDPKHHLEFTQDEKGTGGAAPTKDNLLVLYFADLDVLTQIRTSLEGLGHQPVDPENPYWSGKGWTYEDPDGWRVVLFHGSFLI